MESVNIFPTYFYLGCDNLSDNNFPQFYQFIAHYKQIRNFLNKINLSYNEV